MRKFLKAAALVFVGFAIGVNMECYCMANDKEYHDKWMERFKRN